MIEIAFIVGVILGIVVTYLLLKSRISFEVQKYIQENEERIRKEALEKGRAVLKGKIAEQLACLLPNFPYNPADARFIGNPVDYVVFNGYTEVKDGSKEDLEIVFLEVKSGKSVLSREEKIIKDAVENKKVSWKTLTV